MNATKIEDGIYFLYPEGSAWIGAKIRNGRCVGTCYEADASTHAAANDQWAGVVPSDSDIEADTDYAAQIVREVVGDDADMTMYVVCRSE